MRPKLIILYTIFLIASSCQEKPEPILMPKFSEILVSNISVNSALIQGSINDSGNQDISDHGFVYAENNATPTLTDSKISKGAINRVTPTPIEFSETITNLKVNTEYHIRAYAQVGETTIYGEAAKFKTLNIIQPGIKTNAATNISFNTAKLSATIESLGTNPISEFGVVLSSTNSNPTTTDTKLSKVGNVTSVPFTQVFDATSLLPNTQYNFRAYVISNGVTTYGSVLTFKTLDILQPSIKTVSATAITHNSAKLQGSLESKGSFDISEYGIVLSSTNTNPTVNDTKLSKTGNITNFPSSYTLDATNLVANTTYNFRAYVISNGVTTYGSVLTFKTLAISPASVTTDGSSDITFNSATLSGKIIATGTLGVSEYGFVYSLTNQNPTINDTKAIKSGAIGTLPFAYSVGITNLTANSTYYFRAYAINNGVAVYGNSLNFRTAQVVNPTVNTLAATNISFNTATLRGNVVSAGSFPISEFGICYSATNSNPTTNDIKWIGGTSISSFPREYSFSAQNLNSNTTYYFRAYVVSNGQTFYGSVLNFKTLQITAPTLSTQPLSKNSSTLRITLFGTILTQGNPAISEYGFCWAEGNNNPNINNSKTKVGSNIGSVPFRFSADIGVLTANRTHYYRSYCIAGGVVYYGNVLEYQAGKD
jgi:hypothetical protein